MNDCLQYPLRTRTFDRLRRSIAGEPADGHAVFNYYTFPFYHHVTGVPLDRYFHDPAVMFDIQRQVIEQLDGCGSFQPDTGPVAECSALGAHVRFDKEGFISAGSIEIETYEDAQAIQPGDPWGDNYMRRGLETLQYMVAHAPSGIKVNPPCLHAPFTTIGQLMGVSDLCVATLEEPEMVELLLNTAAETSIRYLKEAEKILGAPLHHILVCDDISSFLSVNAYREWVLPVYQKIFAAFPQTQMWLHNDAKAQHLCGAIADAGFAAWQYAPSIDSAFAMEQTGGRVSLMGGLSPLELQHRTPDETYAQCMEKLESFGGNNKFVLGVGGSVNQIPIENLKAMFRAADTLKL